MALIHQVPSGVILASKPVCPAVDELTLDFEALAVQLPTLALKKSIDEVAHIDKTEFIRVVLRMQIDEFTITVRLATHGRPLIVSLYQIYLVWESGRGVTHLDLYNRLSSYFIILVFNLRCFRDLR